MNVPVCFMRPALFHEEGEDLFAALNAFGDVPELRLGDHFVLDDLVEPARAQR